MGNSSWSDAAYAARQNGRHASGASAFTYDHHVRSSGDVRIHPQMNPQRVTRESRDSAAHPDSLSIAVMFDVTGSMGSVPRVLQTKLGALMRVMIQRGYVAHPQILFGAIGDAYCDQIPLQVGQFESGLEMDDELGKIYIEGGGGGQVHESYELAIYFAARHTSIDCFDKRGRRGYLFTMGDELPYDQVSRTQVAKVIGDKLQRDIPTAQIVAEAQQRFHYFHIIPTNTSHGRDTAIHAAWRTLLGERVLLLEDEAAVCETIALTIGLCEGAVDDLANAGDDLVTAGYDADAVAKAATALRPYADSQPPTARVARGLLPIAPTLDLGNGRL
ncbi:MAG: hypothetical protein H7Z42_19700 [Roseiflexaceae bacterium]|nr:hypothetical protein [Roseiflexaceae bacterium]